MIILWCRLNNQRGRGGPPSSRSEGCVDGCAKGRTRSRSPTISRSLGTGRGVDSQISGAGATQLTAAMAAGKNGEEDRVLGSQLGSALISGLHPNIVEAHINETDPSPNLGQGKLDNISSSKPFNPPADTGPGVALFANESSLVVARAVHKPVNPFYESNRFFSSRIFNQIS